MKTSLLLFFNLKSKLIEISTTIQKIAKIMVVLEIEFSEKSKLFNLGFITNIVINAIIKNTQNIAVRDKR